MKVSRLSFSFIAGLLITSSPARCEVCQCGQKKEEPLLVVSDQWPDSVSPLLTLLSSDQGGGRWRGSEEWVSLGSSHRNTHGRRRLEVWRLLGQWQVTCGRVVRCELVLRFVITAAHCVQDNILTINVTLGRKHHCYIRSNLSYQVNTTSSSRRDLNSGLEWRSSATMYITATGTSLRKGRWSTTSHCSSWKSQSTSRNTSTFGIVKCFW